MCCTCWLAAETNSFRCRSRVRTAQMSCPGRNAARSNPTECKNCNHWHSCQSVRRPGTFFMWRAFTKQGRMPRCSRISKSGIQYTPVASSATVVTPHCSSQSVKRSRSSVKVANTRTGFSSRPGGTATTFLVRQRRCRLHSAPTPADLANTSLCFVSAAWASRPAAANYRSVSFSLVARFLSCKQRPSCAIEDTLPNGISWAGPTVNHCSAHGTWGHAIDRRSNHTPLP
jgi:hypothetical protein